MLPLGTGVEVGVDVVLVQEQQTTTEGTIKKSAVNFHQNCPRIHKDNFFYCRPILTFSYNQKLAANTRNQIHRLKKLITFPENHHLTRFPPSIQQLSIGGIDNREEHSYKETKVKTEKNENHYLFMAGVGQKAYTYFLILIAVPMME